MPSVYNPAYRYFWDQATKKIIVAARESPIGPSRYLAACRIWSLSVRSGLWQAVRTADLWVHCLDKDRLRKRSPNPFHDHLAIPARCGPRIGRGGRAPRVAVLLHVNEPRRSHRVVAFRADARGRQARGEPHLHVVRPTKAAVPRRVIDVNHEKEPALRPVARFLHNVCRERVERGERRVGTRGLDA